MSKIKMKVFDLSVDTKLSAIKEISKKAKELKIVSSAVKLENAFLKREKEFSTGFENGFAIPHARIPEIKEAAILVFKLKKGVDWKSIDNSNAKIIIALMVPDDKETAGVHMKNLSKIAMALTDKEFQNTLKTATKPKMLTALEEALSDKPETPAPAVAVAATNDSSQKKNLKVVAVTACSTGIAHTFMAAKKLEEVAPKKGVQIRVQKNGASGPEDVLTEQEIEEADYVILAVDVVVDESRFLGKKYVKVPVAYAIKETDNLIESLEQDAVVMSGSDEAKAKHEQKKTAQKSSWFYRNVLTHVMNGVSHMIPLLVSAGILLALGKLLASFTGDLKIADNYGSLYAAHGDNWWFKIVYTFNIMGIVSLWLMFPIFGMFTAQSIGGKSAIIPGFLAGIIADGDHLFARIWRTFNIDNATAKGNPNPFPKETYPYVQMSSGFFGILIGSIVIGYFVFYLNRVIKIKGTLAPLKSILIVPGLAAIVVVISQMFIINPPFALLNKGIRDLAENFKSFVIGFGIVVAICTAFDMGGPVNKAVGVVAIGLAADGTIPLTARTISIVIPPIGLGIATLLAKPIFKKELYDADLKTSGRVAIFLGLIAITEGGLPFLFKKPLITISAAIAGALVGSLFVMLTGVQMWQPLPAVYGWGLVGIAPANAAVTSNVAQWFQIILYIMGVILGSLTTAFTDIGLRLFSNKRNAKKEKMQVELN
ncbi:MAG: fructose-specific PTS transporter subunit EIIC [Mycoplasma sp.]|nr:fructose-specific PTS transporter subunit EIIC [Mycoplasma sp.]